MADERSEYRRPTLTVYKPQRRFPGLCDTMRGRKQRDEINRVTQPAGRFRRMLRALGLCSVLAALVGCTTITYKDADIEVTYRRVLTRQAVQYNPSTGLITMDVATDADPALKALEYAARISAAGATVAP